MHATGFIRVEGATQNNLKNLTFDLPLGMFHVLTGPSGSGKSSLAFDTLYAEGQRRYAETFSPYTRQFLERMIDRASIESKAFHPPSPLAKATRFALPAAPSVLSQKLQTILNSSFRD